MTEGHFYTCQLFTFKVWGVQDFMWFSTELSIFFEDASNPQVHRNGRAQSHRRYVLNRICSTSVRTCPKNFGRDVKKR